jgi:hypothetical protein
MKKSTVILAVIGLLFIACKKESGGDTQQKETLLSEAYSNGLLALRFSYDANNYVNKIESFKADLADQSMTSYVVFQHHSDGRIKQYTAYTMPGNVAVGKVTFDHDSAGKLTKASYFDLQGLSPNTALTTTGYAYNTKGQVIKIVEKKKNGELVLQTNLSYYEDGHIKEEQHWSEQDKQLWLKGKISYSSPNGYYPSGLDQLGILLGTNFIANMYSESITYFTYSQLGVITNQRIEQLSAREYNEDGTLKKQITTNKYIKPASADQAFVIEYKYLKQ